MDVSEASSRSEEVIEEISKSVVADRRFLENLLIGVVARGHVLIEDVPGTGKTLTAQTLSSVLGLSFNRIQFTPDLLPADITGTHIYNEKEKNFEFSEGPIFANVVLADEINRAPPKTQAALLEAMAEQQVTVDGETRELPDPFFVIATQNPVESEGTFPLPEAQIDRFIVKTSIGYPEHEEENTLLRRRTRREEKTPSAEQVLSSQEVKELQYVPETVSVNDDMISYMSYICEETRDDERVKHGVSPRGTQRLLETSRCKAVIEGRDYVIPNDVKEVARPVLSHRLVLTPNAAVDEVEKDGIIDDVLGKVKVPTVPNQ